MPYKNKEDLYKRQQLHRDKNMQKLWELLEKSECVDCHIKDPRVLQFDHLPKFEKLFDIARAISGSTRSWESIEKEIKKCDIVCANCHIIRTAKRGNYKRYQLSLNKD